MYTSVGVRRARGGPFEVRGLGASCPPTTFLRDHPEADPCAITYKVDIPILGDSEVTVPLNQMINDVRLQLDQVLPDIVSNVWRQAGPTVLSDIEEEVFRVAPDLANEIIKKSILPVMNQELEKAMAEAEVLRDEAIWAMVGIGVMVAGAVGLGAWWVRKR